MVCKDVLDWFVGYVLGVWEMMRKNDLNKRWKQGWVCRRAAMEMAPAASLPAYKAGGVWGVSATPPLLVDFGEYLTSPEGRQK